ncbi:efflux RND transporter periplasmic adaptor subunit [Luteolibacter flavescens]|uniref:Efflux RND transporter periplasmic adaptor subunit n=1 Tax=Luteolibacter flavescens TaxID=1859460 RepID=A0ABT3FQN3_9BACT|nr:efflux RND transporter periplasmic adaptor subunit [Luteolibacter flavescens]MCW1885888.1 efflux RND transporter periplasmic adaptor subunit [Luteolibacter flavescens]
MSSSDSSKDLAAVLEGGKSRPVLKWVIITALVAAVGASGYSYYKKNKNGDTGPEYVTRSLERGEISIEITATGTLAPTNQVIVGSELSGTIAEVYVDTNDTVKKGQELAKLDTIKLVQQTERTRATLRSAEARVSQAKATLRESTASHERQLELHKLSGGQTPSKADMDTSQATVERAQADLESAEASVAEADANVKANERDLEKAIIRSPVNGTILLRKLEVGQTVAASFTAPELFTIAEDLRKMELVVAVAESDIGRVDKGQAVEFEVSAWPKRTYNASVKKVFYGSTITNNVVTYSTELEVNNDDLSLRPGMTATADIFIERKQDVFVVSNSALRFDPVAAAKLGQGDKDSDRTFVQQLSGGGRRWGRGGSGIPAGPEKKGTSVWVMKDGTPVEVKVTTGLTDGNQTEISGEGLTEGAEIIVSAKPPMKS